MRVKELQIKKEKIMDLVLTIDMGSFILYAWDWKVLLFPE
jgi:hypothetical protein